MEIVILSIFIVVSIIIFSYLMYGKSGKVKPFIIKNRVLEQNNLTLLSINMAHGRGDGRSQILQSSKVINAYVHKIADLIIREDADIVALQEADAPSWWSGNFSHSEEIAKLSNMHFSIQGEHVSGFGLQYGTSLIGKLNVIEAYSQTFTKSIPMLSKGFVMATCQWQGLIFDVVSLHLDFARSVTRQKQLNLLETTLKKQNRPMIIMGDFNTDMSTKLLPDFMQELNLYTWRPNDKEIVTFPSLGGYRIDWILISQEFKIIDHQILDDIVSDHLSVKMILEIDS